ncbi:MAG: class I SAM-dependent methyltransferase [Chlamydiae bacterium]|nr:class I SAM-dependent methyltransferase [Chlamydiota bacterium]
MGILINKEKVLNKEYGNDKALDFIAAGVACYAFSLIDELGLVEELTSERGLSSDSFRAFPNPLVVREAIQTLECNNIVFSDKGIFRLTSLGNGLVQHRSSIGLIYNGYRQVLSNQMKIAQDQPAQYRDLMDEIAISKASSHMGNTFFYDKLLKILKINSIKGTICDLGCGNASTLIHLCKMTKLPGLGFDFSSSSIEIAKSSLNANDRITLQVQDISNISEIYPEVEVVLQSFVMHDFSDNMCKRMIGSLLKSFPNAKTVIYIDAVSPENGNLFQLPGFDFVHSLLGIKPRTVAETSRLLAESGLQIMNQEPIFGLTNCYIWTLRPFI